MSTIYNDEEQESLPTPHKNTSKDLIFADDIVDKSGQGQFGFIVITAKRARDLYLGEPRKISAKSYEPIATVSMLEIANDILTIDQIKEDYILSPSDTTYTTNEAFSAAEISDTYEEYMRTHAANTTDEGGILSNTTLAALWDNPND